MGVTSPLKGLRMVRHQDREVGAEGLLKSNHCAYLGMSLSEQ